MTVVSSSDLDRLSPQELQALRETIDATLKRKQTSSLPSNYISLKRVSQGVIDSKSEPSERFEHVPTPSFRLIIIAPPGGGKTQLTVDLLINHYYEIFKHQIFLISSNYDYEKEQKWGLLPLNDDPTDPACQVKRVYDSNWLRELRQLKDEKERNATTVTPALIIIEDVLEQIPFNDPELVALFTHGRVKGWSIIFLTQKYKRIHPTLRSTATDLVMLGITDRKEQEQICEENCDSVPWKVVLKMYHQVRNKGGPYSFLWIDRKKNLFHDGFSNKTLNEMYTDSI